MSTEDTNPKPTILGVNYNSNNNNRLQFPSHQIKGVNRLASTIDSPRTVFTKSQLLEMADAYVNDGIMRRCVNTLVMGIKGKRIKFVVEPNEEISELLNDEEKQQLNDSITKNDRVPELKRKQIRIDKRCKLNERMDTFLKSFFVFGRAISGIVRFPKTDEFPLYGEPKAIQPLNTIRITDIEVDKQTYELKGVEYDFGEQTKKMIRPLNMIFGVNDDNNLYDNTNYSGISPVWTCLSASQSNIVINDEDIPEATRSVAHKFGFIKTGTQKASVVEQIRDQLQMGTWLVHNQEGLTADVYDMARDLTELPKVREFTSKYMTWSMMVPEFMIFESAANFATADKSIQVWKSVVIDYYRTIVQGILEQYWYDPIVADHYGIRIEDVISQRIKMKPIFEDLIFDTYKENVDATMALVNGGVLTELQALDKLGLDKYVQERRQLEAELLRQREEDIKAREEQLRSQQGLINNASQQKQINPFQKQDNQQGTKDNRKPPF